MGPVGVSRVGFVDGKYVFNPSKKELEKSKLDFVVAGTKDAVLMVESEAKGLTEEEMLNAVKFGHENFIPIIKMIEELAKECKKPDWVIEKKDLSEVKKKLSDEFTDDLKKAFFTRDKQERSNMISEITDKAKKLYEENETITDLDVNFELKNLEKIIVRTDILKNKNRIDGRGLSDVRPIMCEVGILP
jgi:Polyribonucleotide nucleotidyltransferase (polynucleotide phosphorylase)